MKYEGMKDNAVRGDVDTFQEQNRKIGNALTYAISAARYQCIAAFQKEATKFMKAAGIPEREIRWAVSDYSGKLKHAILDLNTSINKQFM